MKRRDFIKGAATCAAGLATGVNLFAKQIGEIGATNLTDGVDLSGAKNLGEKLAAMTPYLTLNNRILMPIVGFSADKFDGSKDKNVLEAALELGYRLVDTDRGEEGAAVAFAASGLERGQLFIQSSVGAQNADESDMIKSFERSLKKTKYRLRRSTFAARRGGRCWLCVARFAEALPRVACGCDRHLRPSRRIRGRKFSQNSAR